MYTDINYKTKTELRKAIKSGVEVSTFQPGGVFQATRTGVVTIEGPQYPAPHRWYARVEILDGIITKLIS